MLCKVTIKYANNYFSDTNLAVFICIVRLFTYLCKV